ncbi:MAG: DUF1569 domain-containing protein [Planctomycetaceae bacterium]
MPDKENYQRRRVRYDSLDEFRLDVDFFAQHAYVTVGNWSYPQILTHLYRVMNASFDGFPFMMPWPVRFMARLFRKPVFHFGFPSGFKMPRQAKPFLPEDAEDLPTAVEKMHDAIHRLQDHVPNKPHAVFGHMDYDDWVRCHLRHAELHMSFVVPLTGSDAKLGKDDANE